MPGTLSWVSHSLSLGQSEEASWNLELAGRGGEHGKEACLWHPRLYPHVWYFIAPKPARQVKQRTQQLLPFFRERRHRPRGDELHAGGCEGVGKSTDMLPASGFV